MGYDSGKQVKRRKRFILVDTLRLLRRILLRRILRVSNSGARIRERRGF
jgi:hypothetical protein